VARLNAPLYAKGEILSTVRIRLTKDEALDMECFGQKLSKQASIPVVFYNPGKKKVIVKSRFDCTRYSKAGQIRIKNKIRKRLGRYYFRRAVMLTPTFDPSKISRPEAWRILGRELRRLENGINQHRKRRGFKEAVAYMEVKECGKSNGYPHFHVVYPGLKYLADWEVIRGLWGHGNIDINYGGSLKPASYACKYISKMGANNLGLMYMGKYGIKLYTFSRRFEYLQEDKEKGWLCAWKFPSGLGSVDAFIRSECEGYEIEEGEFYSGVG